MLPTYIWKTCKSSAVVYGYTGCSKCWKKTCVCKCAQVSDSDSFQGTRGLGRRIKSAYRVPNAYFFKSCESNVAKWWVLIKLDDVYTVFLSFSIFLLCWKYFIIYQTGRKPWEASFQDDRWNTCVSLFSLPIQPWLKLKLKAHMGKKVAEGTSMYVISAHVWKTEAVGCVITIWKDRKSGSHTSKCVLRGLGETNRGSRPQRAAQGWELQARQGTRTGALGKAPCFYAFFTPPCIEKSRQEWGKCSSGDMEL